MRWRHNSGSYAVTTAVKNSSSAAPSSTDEHLAAPSLKRNRHLMEDMVSPLSTLRGIAQHHIGQSLSGQQAPGRPGPLHSQASHPALTSLSSLQPEHANSPGQPEPLRRASTNSVRLPGESQFQLGTTNCPQAVAGPPLQPSSSQQQQQQQQQQTAVTQLQSGQGQQQQQQQQVNPQHPSAVTNQQQQQQQQQQLVNAGSAAAAAGAQSFYHPNGKGPPQQLQQHHMQQMQQSSMTQQQQLLSQQHQQQQQQHVATIGRAAWVLRTILLYQAPQLLRDRRVMPGKPFRRCMVGTEMVDWLLQMGCTHVRLSSRAQAAGMWQVLLEEGCINHVTGERQFEDKYLFYRFREDDTPHPWLPTSEERHQAECELQECLVLLMQLAPDANLRMILRKPPLERRKDDLDTIYEELTRIKALSHLSNSVKRELSGVMVFELHPKRDTVLFNQGDEGKSWYIILKGSVNVVIYGKGVVCVLHEGDDFGKLALVNDAPRAATIITRGDNCHLLRVDKHDFNRIIRDVEANTVRLKEHGQDVLVLQKTGPGGQEGQAGTPGTNGPSGIGQPQTGLNGQPNNSQVVSRSQNAAVYNSSHYKYTVMAGTPQKMLEHLLETRIGERNDEHHVLLSGGASTANSGADSFLQDFLLTHVIFMPSHSLCPELMRHYRLDAVNQRQEREFILASKRRVVHFTAAWANVVREPFYEDPVVQGFLEELLTALEEDRLHYPGNYLSDQQAIVQRLFDIVDKYRSDPSYTSVQKWKVDMYGHVRLLSSGSTQNDDTANQAGGGGGAGGGVCGTPGAVTATVSASAQGTQAAAAATSGPQGSTSNSISGNTSGSGSGATGSSNAVNSTGSAQGPAAGGGSGAQHEHLRPIKDTDEIIFRVYCADHTYVTLKTPVGATAEYITRLAAEKIQQDEAMALVEVKSNGERLPFTDSEVSVATGLSINGRLFIVPVGHVDALTTLLDQDGPKVGTGNILEAMSSQDIAYHMTVYEWKLFTAVHEYELIYQVFGRHVFRRNMSNLDVFQRRFNQVQFWVVTEMCLTNSLSRRVQLLRKFIKIAQHCRDHQNLNALFAIVMGLGNAAVSRLSQTWERLPSKLRKSFEELENLIEPSRNHKRYRSAVAKLQPPLIPFMPLMLKDMTFCHLGNKTWIDGLVNFEKMHMIGQTLRHMRYARSQWMTLERPHSQAASKSANHHDTVADYIRNLKVIDNQQILTKLSHSLEPRR